MPPGLGRARPGRDVMMTMRLGPAVGSGRRRFRAEQ